MFDTRTLYTNVTRAHCHYNKTIDTICNKHNNDYYRIETTKQYTNHSDENHNRSKIKDRKIYSQKVYAKDTLF